MSKPSWDEAPEWANWLAMDEGGEWYRHEEVPVALHGEHDYGKNYWSDGGRYQYARPVDPEWTTTLERRP